MIFCIFLFAVLRIPDSRIVDLGKHIAGVSAAVCFIDHHELTVIQLRQNRHTWTLVCCLHNDKWAGPLAAVINGIGKVLVIRAVKSLVGIEAVELMIPDKEKRLPCCIVSCSANSGERPCDAAVMRPCSTDVSRNAQIKIGFIALLGICRTSVSTGFDGVAGAKNRAFRQIADRFGHFKKLRAIAHTCHAVGSALILHIADRQIVAAACRFFRVAGTPCRAAVDAFINREAGEIFVDVCTVAMLCSNKRRVGLREAVALKGCQKTAVVCRVTLMLQLQNTRGERRIQCTRNVSEFRVNLFDVLVIQIVKGRIDRVNHVGGRIGNRRRFARLSRRSCNLNGKIRFPELSLYVALFRERKILKVHRRACLSSRRGQIESIRCTPDAVETAACVLKIPLLGVIFRVCGFGLNGLGFIIRYGNRLVVLDAKQLIRAIGKAVERIKLVGFCMGTLAGPGQIDPLAVERKIGCTSGFRRNTVLKRRCQPIAEIPELLVCRIFCFSAELKMLFHCIGVFRSGRCNVSLCGVVFDVDIAVRTCFKAPKLFVIARVDCSKVQVTAVGSRNRLIFRQVYHAIQTIRYKIKCEILIVLCVRIHSRPCKKRTVITRHIHGFSVRRRNFALQIADRRHGNLCGRAFCKYCGRQQTDKKQNCQQC